MFSNLFSGLFGGTFWLVFKYLIIFYPIWLPIAMAALFWDVWLRYVRAHSASKTKMILLEIKLPRELMKSPLAMEIALNSLHQTGGEATFIDRYWDGKFRSISSLELVSFGGEVHFFMWIREGMRPLVESQLYAQYPSIEIYEVPDYTHTVNFNPDVNAIWGTEYEFTKPDPYPIKTYVDYGLDRDPKEEFKNDPLTAVLEFLGSLRKGEQAWIQIIIRAHKKEKHGGVFSKKSDWQDEAKKIVKDIIANATLRPEGQERGGVLNLSDGEKQLIAGIERTIAKQAFDTGIRSMYIAPKDMFSRLNVGGLLGSFKHFSSNTANAIKPARQTDFDYPWQDYKNIRLNSAKRKMLQAYKKRAYFWKPVKRKPLILSTEELATLFHFPGDVAATPTLTRIPSKKAEAPSNLPI
jgi:hypothetical protein